MNSTDVLVIGAGPIGLTLACALAQKKISTVVVDRQAEGESTSRAAVVNARSLEVLERLDAAEQLMARGLRAPRFTIRDGERTLFDVDFAPLPTRYPFSLMVSQATTEEVLLRRLMDMGGSVQRPRTLVAVHQHDDGVTAEFVDGDTMSARYVIGADGVHSTVRSEAGIGFDGAPYDQAFVLADVRISGDTPVDEVILFWARAGMTVVAPLPDGVHRVVAPVRHAPRRLTPEFVQELLDIRGPGEGRMRVLELVWGSKFTVQHRVADTFRAGRLLLAGDAAHVHSPAGGQGMNLGIQDASALADALAAALLDHTDSQLDDYSRERRPIAVHVVSMTDRLTRLATAPAGVRSVRNIGLRAVSHLPAARRRAAWQLSGLRYR